MIFFYQPPQQQLQMWMDGQSRKCSWKGFEEVLTLFMIKTAVGGGEAVVIAQQVAGTLRDDIINIFI